jgi:hypothetical protein
LRAGGTPFRAVIKGCMFPSGTMTSVSVKTDEMKSVRSIVPF